MQWCNNDREERVCRSILPFIMIGIGVDGMFVLQGALDNTDITQVRTRPSQALPLKPPLLPGGIS